MSYTVLPIDFGLCSGYNKKCFESLGDRLVVGRRVLAPLARVRVLLPQPVCNLQLSMNNYRYDN